MIFIIFIWLNLIKKTKNMNQFYDNLKVFQLKPIFYNFLKYYLKRY